MFYIGITLFIIGIILDVTSITFEFIIIKKSPKNNDGKFVILDTNKTRTLIAVNILLIIGGVLGGIGGFLMHP